MECNSTIIDQVDFSQWIDQEPRLKLPITKATLEKAIRLGAEHAKRLNDAEAARISRQGCIPCCLFFTTSFRKL
ncbi:unnamed protein product [Toxocara canis]|uniref:DUF3606 domain-containing protein n=1 Tax=Toxocara canis TaxID=6265 RepID=A0A183U1B4_TOXCA|nr:unnamed protein product [Toxocara canis]